MTDSDDERARGREAILKRRAKLVAYAVAAGIAMPACGGKSSDGPCLSPLIGGTANDGGKSASAGTGYCLSVPGGSSYGGYGGTSLCLGMPYAGETYCLSGGGPPEGGMGGEGGLGGGGDAGEPPIFCLSAPLGGAPPLIDDGGESGTGLGGAG